MRQIGIRTDLLARGEGGAAARKHKEIITAGGLGRLL
jgi:hypothetical protein